MTDFLFTPAFVAWAALVVFFAGAITEAFKRAVLPLEGAKPSRLQARADRLIAFVPGVFGAIVSVVSWEGVPLDLPQRLAVGAALGGNASWLYSAFKRAFKRQTARAIGLPAGDSKEDVS